VPLREEMLDPPKIGMGSMSRGGLGERMCAMGDGVKVVGDKTGKLTVDNVYSTARR
jgi:hypothetical protein